MSVVAAPKTLFPFKPTFIAAWLVCICVATDTLIEQVDRRQDRIGIFPRSATAGIRQDVGSSPVGLQEAEDLWSLRVTVGARLANLRSQSTPFNKSSILTCCCEERRAVHFLPQIEACLIPVRRDVRKIVRDDRPDHICYRRVLSFRDKVARVSNHGRCSQGRSVTLRSAPCACELCLVDIESARYQSQQR